MELRDLLTPAKSQPGQHSQSCFMMELSRKPPPADQASSCLPHAAHSCPGLGSSEVSKLWSQSSPKISEHSNAPSRVQLIWSLEMLLSSEQLQQTMFHFTIWFPAQSQSLSEVCSLRIPRNLGGPPWLPDEYCLRKSVTETETSTTNGLDQMCSGLSLYPLYSFRQNERLSSRNCPVKTTLHFLGYLFYVFS